MYYAIPRKRRKLKNDYKKERKKAIESKDFSLYAKIIFLIILESFAKEGIMNALNQANNFLKRKKLRRYNI